MHFLLHPKKLQLELSSMCNALCLGCQRTNSMNYNEVKSCIPKKQIVEPSTIENLLNSDIMSKLEVLEFCGTIDEPLIHPNFFEILDIAYEINPNYAITIHTNASLRSEEDWKKLATSLKRFKTHDVHFSIDGLEDTHSIYRQWTDYNKIIKNAIAFISEGGTAIWQYLIFPWNESQVIEAKNISQQLGFAKFHKRHDRSHVSQDGLDMIMRMKRENYTGLGKSKPKDYSEKELLPIECNSLKNNMYFLSYDSRLWPCCFLSNGFYMAEPSPSFLNKRIYENYGHDFNDLTKHNADEIVKSNFYSNDLIDSFENTISEGPCGKITRCADTCTVKQLQINPIGKVEEIK
jgi:hypothetical protein